MKECKFCDIEIEDEGTYPDGDLCFNCTQPLTTKD